MAIQFEERWLGAVRLNAARFPATDNPRLRRAEVRDWLQNKDRPADSPNFAANNAEAHADIIEFTGRLNEDQAKLLSRVVGRLQAQKQVLGLDDTLPDADGNVNLGHARLRNFRDVRNHPEDSMVVVSYRHTGTKALPVHFRFTNFPEREV